MSSVNIKSGFRQHTSVQSREVFTREEEAEEKSRRMSTTLGRYVPDDRSVFHLRNWDEGGLSGGNTLEVSAFGARDTQVINWK